VISTKLGRGGSVTMTIKSCKHGATTLSRMNFSAYAGRD